MGCRMQWFQWDSNLFIQAPPQINTKLKYLLSEIKKMLYLIALDCIDVPNEVMSV